MRRRIAVAVLLSLPWNACFAAAPGDSLYALSARLTDQDGHALPFDAYRGHPVLISMFYASCGYVCPTLIANLQRLEGGLDAASRARLRVLMVSVDPEKDTVAALRALADEHHADTARWSFTRAEESDVRKVAALLGVQYRKLPNGDYNHSVLVTLVDGNGAVLSRSASLSGADPGFAAALRAATAGRPVPPH